MSSLDKLQRDYQAFVENVERTAAVDVEKIRQDLCALKAKASEIKQTV
jgi:hypothetical protein